MVGGRYDIRLVGRHVAGRRSLKSCGVGLSNLYVMNIDTRCTGHW